MSYGIFEKEEVEVEVDVAAGVEFEEGEAATVCDEDAEEGKPSLSVSAVATLGAILSKGRDKRLLFC